MTVDADPYVIAINPPVVPTVPVALSNSDSTVLLVPQPGNEGPPGAAGSLTIGTVTGGGEAAASITGEAPDQVLNLVLPRGPAGDATPITGEVPVGVRDGVNEVFTLANPFLPGSTSVHRNGLREVRGVGYTESSPNIVFTTAPLLTDVVIVDYLIGD